MPAVGPVIAAAAAESSPAKVLVDGSGLADNDSDRLVEHGTNEDSMWIAQSDMVDEGLVFDLPQEYMLESIAVWNYNKPGYTDMGVQTADIAVWTETDGWKTVLKEAHLQEAEGTDDYDEPTILTFEPVKTQKIRFENLTAFNSNAGQVGLSEIAFYEPLGPAACNPEPSDGAAVACLDTVPLMWTAGKNAIAHDVYIGDSVDTLTLLGRVKGTPQVNVSGLAAGTGYVWRIDEVAVDGTIEQGPVWSFKMRGQQIAHWKLDDTAEDELGRYTGTVTREPTWQPGHSGGAVELDGEGDGIEIPALNLNTNLMTICAWMNAGEQTATIPGIVFCRTGRTVAGINLQEDNLRYHWNDSSATYNWNSGLTVPQNQWVFVALTVTPQKGTLYLYDGNEFKASENPIRHTAEEFDGPLYIGMDPYDNRYFKGLIDEVRIFDYALSPSQIESIARDEQIKPSESVAIRLVDADLVTEGESLADIAAQQAADPDGVKKKNLLVVGLIVLVFVGFAGASILRKKK